jgi:hypothetical protein
MEKQEVMNEIEEIRDELERIKDGLEDQDTRHGIEGMCDDIAQLMVKVDDLQWQLNANTNDF